MSTETPGRSRPEENDALIVFGAGGHGLVVAEAAEAAGWKIHGFWDDYRAPEEKISRWSVLGAPVLEAGLGEQVIVALGDNRVRWEQVNALVASRVRLACVVHPAAAVSVSARLDAGVFVGAGAVVNAEAAVGPGGILNSGCVVEHHVALDDAVHVGPAAVLAGGVVVGARVLIGAGAVVLPRVRIGADAVVGAGAVVTTDVPAGQTVMGNPARQRR